jgi:hypothetical protein
MHKLPSPKTREKTMNIKVHVQIKKSQFNVVDFIF